MAAPETKNQLRQLLGFFSYFREFIPNYAELTKPLRDLTAKRVPNVLTNCWKEQHEETFQTLKDVLIQATDNPLFVADFSKPFNVTVDASNHALAGLLSQYDDEGQDRPIAFASQKLTPTQQAWSTVEREAYTVIWAITKYRRWLFANEVVVFSDNNPLVFLTESVPKAPKLMRRALALQQFNCTFKYKVGKTNVVADCLSRPVSVRE